MRQYCLLPTVDCWLLTTFNSKPKYSMLQTAHCDCPLLKGWQGLGRRKIIHCVELPTAHCWLLTTFNSKPKPPMLKTAHCDWLVEIVEGVEIVQYGGKSYIASNCALPTVNCWLLSIRSLKLQCYKLPTAHSWLRTSPFTRNTETQKLQHLVQNYGRK